MSRLNKLIFIVNYELASIAEGNARIAILAGKIASDANRLDSINDVSQL